MTWPLGQARQIGAGALLAVLLVASSSSATHPSAVPPLVDVEISVPGGAVAQPASVPAGASGAGRPDVTDLSLEPGLRASPTSARDPRVDPGVDLSEPLDVPARALAAYRFAAGTLAEADPGCHLSWPVLAGIGRVESDHGRYAGSVLGDDGVSAPLLRGVALDGTGGGPRVPDTDGGLLDQDPRWDRAVGPMQLLPSTWVYVGVDADGDRARSAVDLDDAALGAAVYLCAGEGDLGTPAGLRAALRSYNPADAYVAAVLEVTDAYAAGRFEEIWPAVPELTARAMPEPTVGGTVQARPTARPAEPDPTPTPPTPPPPAPVPPAPSPPAPAPPPSTPPEPTAPDEPTQPPEQPPEQPPGTPHGPDTEADVEPDAEPDTEPDTGSGPPLTVVFGSLREVDGRWLVDEMVLDVGDEALLAGTALHDLDGDGLLESNAAELSGLVEVPDVVWSVETVEETGSAVLWAVGGLAYRSE